MTALKIVIDVDLSPDWVDALTTLCCHAVHWTHIGNPRANDREIMDWAKQNRYVVFTQDLDFGTMLALTRAGGPSVLQVRAQDVLPDHFGPTVAAALSQHAADLLAGALVVVEEARARVRILPL